MPPGWGATRNRILARDPVCRFCQIMPSTEVHHLIPGDERDELLAGVCHDCHARATAVQSAEARGLA